MSVGQKRILIGSFLLNLILLLCLVPSCFAVPNDALDRFKEKFGGHRWIVEWDQNNQSVKSLLSVGGGMKPPTEIPQSETDASRIAENILLEFSDLFGVKSGQLSKPKVLVGKFWTVKFEQMLDGIPVETVSGQHATISVNIYYYRENMRLPIKKEIDGMLSRIESSLLPNLQGFDSSTVTEQEAITAAQSNVTEKSTGKALRMVIIPGEGANGGNAHRAWKVQLTYPNNPLSAPVVYVDAESGEIIRSRETVIIN